MAFVEGVEQQPRALFLFLCGEVKIMESGLSIIPLTFSMLHRSMALFKVLRTTKQLLSIFCFSRAYKNVNFRRACQVDQTFFLVPLQRLK